MIRPPRTKRDRTVLGVLLAPSAFWLILFFMIPLIIIFAYSFMTRGTYGNVVWEFQIGNYVRFLSDSLYVRIFLRSLMIATLTTVICLVMGYPMAYWLANRSSKTRNAYLLLLMIPFWTNFVIRTYAWRFLLLRTGLINQALLSLGLIQEPLTLLFNEQAVILGLVYGWVVGMVLPCYASITGLDRSLLEAAEDLYANKFKTFMRVTLPLTLPGVVSGSILVFVPTLGAYITPDLLGGGKSDMIGNLIQQQFGEATDWPFGSAISFVLMIIMLLGTVLYFRSLRNERAQLR